MTYDQIAMGFANIIGVLCLIVAGITIVRGYPAIATDITLTGVAILMFCKILRLESITEEWEKQWMILGLNKRIKSDSDKQWY